jgi:hypothetical protein
VSRNNKSHYSKNRSTNYIAVINIITVKYPKNLIYLLIITRIVLVTPLVLILVGNKPIIKSIVNFNIGPYRIGSTNNSLYRRYLDIYTLWPVLYLNI